MLDRFILDGTTKLLPGEYFFECSVFRFSLCQLVMAVAEKDGVALLGMYVVSRRK